MFEAFLQLNDLSGIVQPGLDYPVGENRDAWHNLSLGQVALDDAYQAAEEPYPQLLATDFLEFVRSGNRRIWEEPCFARRQKLIRCCIGECILWKGTFVDEVVNGLWLLAEESSWVISAHNVDDHPGCIRAKERPLPDVENPVLDLFSAQTAATVTLCCHLLKSKLDGVTPLVHRRMQQEVERRILTPFLQRDDFWWMGIVRSNINNWTPWIVSNVLICLLYWEKDSHRLAEGMRRAMQMIDRYICTMPNDGGCDEGTAYWNMAGGALLDCLERLYQATAGKVNFYSDPKIKAIGLFPVKAHITGPWFWNFADCDAKPHLDGERVYTFGMRIQEESLKSLGILLMEADVNPWPKDTPQMTRVLDRLLLRLPVRQDEKAAGNGLAEGTVIMPDLQVWACRKGRYYAAVKGGNNAENHNHNDVGAFLLYVDGQPAVVDMGNMVYTAVTFSDERYTLQNTRSRNHNVPLVSGVEQSAGMEYYARNVQMNADEVSMDIASAYPKRCGLQQCIRTAWLTKEGFLLRDELTFDAAKETAWVFIFREEPVLVQGGCTAGNVRLMYPQNLSAQVEAIPISDFRLARNYPGKLWRLQLNAAAAQRHRMEFAMEGF